MISKIFKISKEYLKILQPCQRWTARQQEPTCQSPLGEMAPCLDDVLGTRSSSQGKVELPPGTGKGQTFRLGRLAETFPQAPQQQEKSCHGSFPQIRRGPGRFLDPRRFHRRHFEESIPVKSIRNECCG